MSNSYAANETILNTICLFVGNVKSHSLLTCLEYNTTAAMHSSTSREQLLLKSADFEQYECHIQIS